LNQIDAIIIGMKAGEAGGGRGRKREGGRERKIDVRAI